MNTIALAYLTELHVKAALFTALVLSIAYLVRRNSSQNRYSVLRMALGILAILPLLALTLPNYILPLDWWTSQSTDIALQPLPSNTTPTETGTQTGGRFQIETFLLSGYAIVCAILIVRTIVGYLRTRREIRSYKAVDHAELNALFENISRRIGVRSDVRFVADPTGIGPYVWGIRTRAIAVPSSFLSATVDVQRTVLTHEMVHIVRRDAISGLVSRMLCCLYWANPFVWLLDARLKLEMERSCDDRAVCSGIDAADYAGHLLEAIRQFDVSHRSGSTIAMARASTIQHRIQSLLNRHRKRGNMSRSKSLVTFGILLLLGATIGTLAAKPEISEAAETKTTFSSADLLANANTEQGGTVDVLAAVKRLTPDDCNASEIKMVAQAVEINGHCASVSRISAFMRNLEREGGKPALASVLKATEGVDFKMRLTNLETFAKTPKL